MSVSLLTPDLRRILDDLAGRIGILERRTKQTAAPVAPVDGSLYAHAGTGTNSVILEPAGGQAVASMANAIAVGAGPTSDAAAQATGTGAVAIGASYDDVSGFGAKAAGAGAVAVGGGDTGASAQADGSVAMGSASQVSASHANSVALGASVATRAANQVTIGSNRLMMGAPDSAPSDSHLGLGQASFYLDEGSNLLQVKVKYSDGTVKSGAVSLS